MREVYIVATEDADPLGAEGIGEAFETDDVRLPRPRLPLLSRLMAPWPFPTRPEEELFDVAELALRFPAPPSKGLAMVTDSGAIKGLALDYCETLGLDLPPLSPDLGATIQAELPDFVDASNPLDLTAQAITHPEMYKRTIKRAGVDHFRRACGRDPVLSLA